MKGRKSMGSMGAVIIVGLMGVVVDELIHKIYLDLDVGYGSWSLL